MAKGILGRKIGMTQVFAENGDLIPVTVIEATPNVVLQRKLLKQTATKQFKLVSKTSALSFLTNQNKVT